MACAPSPTRPSTTISPRRTAANSALRHTAHHGLPSATRRVSCTTNTVHPAVTATNRTTPTHHGRPPAVVAAIDGRTSAQTSATSAPSGITVSIPTQVSRAVKRPAPGIHRSMPTLRLSWAIPPIMRMAATTSAALPISDGSMSRVETTHPRSPATDPMAALMDRASPSSRPATPPRFATAGRSASTHTARSSTGPSVRGRRCAEAERAIYAGRAPSLRATTKDRMPATR